MTILASDLNDYVTGSMSSLIADKELLTRSHQFTFQFQDYRSGDSAEKKTKRFVVPRSCFVESVFAYGVNPISETITVNIVGDGALVNWPIQISGTFNGSFQLDRKWYNNAQTKTGDRSFRVLPQGSTISVSVDTTNTTGNRILTVGLLLRQFYGR